MAVSIQPFRPQRNSAGGLGETWPQNCFLFDVVIAALPTTIGENGFDRLLPHGGVLVTRRALNGDSDPFPEEMAAIARAAPARRREFFLGRRCAREALALLDGPRVAIPMGRFRDPVWPFGYVGSITHNKGFCAAAVAKTGSGAGTILGIGIDCEPSAPLPEEFPALICSSEEHAWLGKHHHDGVPWDRLFFCAKESVYKALFPATHCFLEIRDVGIRFDPEGHRFEASVPDLPMRSPHTVVGRYLIRDDIMLATATWLKEPTGS
jgi:4'-phosphopantetheinyl transferase EntD